MSCRISSGASKPDRGGVPGVIEPEQGGVPGVQPEHAVASLFQLVRVLAHRPADLIADPGELAGLPKLHGRWPPGPDSVLRASVLGSAKLLLGCSNCLLQLRACRDEATTSTAPSPAPWT